ITPTVFYRTLNVEGLEIFYREAGPRDAPTVLLLHGFPSSSHMFRNLIPSLRLHIMSLPQTSLDMAKAQHRRSTSLMRTDRGTRKSNCRSPTMQHGLWMPMPIGRSIS